MKYLLIFCLAASAQAAKYRVERSYPHGGPYVGQPTVIQFSLFRGTETTPLQASDLQLEHEKLIHMMAVDSGFQYFLHEHPEEVQPGVWEVPVNINIAGDYKFFVQMLPEDEITTKTVTFENRFVTDPSQMVPSSPVNPNEQLEFIDGEFRVRLTFLGEKPQQKKLAEAKFIIEKNGVEIPSSDLELYLGARAHIAGISADKSEFVHAHPEPTDVTKLYFQQAGYYGVFMQYQYQGVVHTNQFALQVRPASAPMDSTYSWLNANIFQAKCALMCHQPESPDGNVDFSSYQALLESSGLLDKPIDPGFPEKSGVWIQVKQKTMPKSLEKLSSNEVQAIYDWIKAGAKNDE